MSSNTGQFHVLVAHQQPVLNQLCQLIKGETSFSLKSTLPQDHDTPPLILKRLYIPDISFPVTPDFFSPELRTAGRPLEQVTIVAMPEATINLDNCSVFGKYQIRFARQIPGMQAKTEAPGMKGFSDQNFRFGVLASDTRHHSTAGILGDNIHNRGKPFRRLQLAVILAG